MTREHKLALIIGFMLVMVVGVLLSDHFSRARESRIAAVGPGEGEVYLPMGASPGAFVRPVDLDEPGDLRGEGLDGATEPSGEAEPDEGAREPAGSPGAAAPLRISMGGSEGAAPGGSILDDIPSKYRELFDEVRNGTLLGQVDEPAEPSRDAGGSKQERAIPIDPGAVPAWRWHTVKKGETLYAISKRYLGDGNRWREIASRNASRIDPDGGVREGVRLEVPGAGPANVAPAPGPKPAPPPGQRRYAVKKGESLGVIAQRELGTVKRQGEILRLNRGTIDDADEIRAGMILVLPAS